MLDIGDLTGSYRESGRWWDSQGNTGQLQGSIDVSANGDQLTFKLDAGHVMKSGRLQRYAPTMLKGSGGGATTSGILYLGDRTVILDYVADVRGRKERNTDVWNFAGDGLNRGGIIRQDERTIWFEASMRQSS